jgi:hypothetical protein
MLAYLNKQAQIKGSKAKGLAKKVVLSTKGA